MSCQDPEYGRPSLRVNFSWALVGSAVYSGCQYLFLVIIAKLGTQDQLGLYTLAIASSLPFFGMANLQLRDLLVTDADYGRRFGAYWGTRLVTLLLAIVLVLISVAALGYDGSSIIVVLIFSCGLFFENTSDFILHISQHHERIVSIAISRISKGVAMVAVFGGTLAATHDLVVATAARSLVILAVLCAIDIPAARRAAPMPLHLGAPDLRFGVLRQMALTALPLGIYAWLMSLNSSVPQLLSKRAPVVRPWACSPRLPI